MNSNGNKYRNVKTEIDGIRFDSKKEAARYCVLKLLERQGVIRELERQVRLPLEINGEKVCTYICDFRYEARRAGTLLPESKRWQTVYEDAKGLRTPVYLLKKKLVKAILGVEILET